ncbi:unnamed protein product [Hyaloperonospora brassicae]|uniref:HORMA domain-containing protein n=1 Tax=Hyaloperonospora brassicae TaxID=162125 RepID=A0AAV0UIR3_HYABA|nr:unnamed protein product [Hyaloperonospora brassicae]
MSAYCRVTYETVFDDELRVFVTTQLIKYVLFMRGQVPCLYDELLHLVERFRRKQHVDPLKIQRLRVRGGLQEAVKCVEAAEQLFRGHLDAVFATQVKRVALVFGSSTMSPREAFIVDFQEVVTEKKDADGCVSSTAPSPPHLDVTGASLEDSPTRILRPARALSREKVMHLCAQKCMRAVSTHLMQHVSSALPATKLHVAVLAKRQPTRVAGFIPKQHFKLRLPNDKRGVRTHYVTICSKAACENDESMSTEASADTSDSDMLWYVLEQPIPGFSEVISTRSSGQ